MIIHPAIFPAQHPEPHDRPRRTPIIARLLKKLEKFCVTSVIVVAITSDHGFDIWRRPLTQQGGSRLLNLGVGSRLFRRNRDLYQSVVIMDIQRDSRRAFLIYHAHILTG
jgi:hypothetical protein